jgi:predicted CXXCH cytochrome family protein
MSRRRGRASTQAPSGSGGRLAGVPDPVARRSRRLRIAGAALVGVAAALLGSLLVRHGGGEPAAPAAPQPIPAPASSARYAADSECADCHAGEYRAWRGSHHERAMAPASDSTVLGDFADARFTRQGVAWRFFKRDGKFFVNTAGPDGSLRDFEVTYTFGVDPLQQYLVPFPGGRLQALTIAWDTRRKRWFDLQPGTALAPDDPLRWTGRYQNWNLMCAECHTTNLQKGYDPEADAYHTVWDAPNVGCQACHGPGAAHVERARAERKGAATPAYSDGSGSGLIVAFRPEDPRGEVELCATCHSRRQRLRDGEAPGRGLLENDHPVLLQEGLYEPDGQQLDEVYVWGSFLQSAMFRRGVRCSDCHDPHSAGLVAEGNALCVRCHRDGGNPRFPTLTSKSYDTPAHHFHPSGSAGAQCVACHMPSRNYMIVDARADHGFRIPRPDLSERLGTPNACTQCHADRSAGWAAARVAERTGPGRRREPGFAETFAAARAGRPEARPGLAALVGDSAQPGIVRATALELLGGYGTGGEAAIVEATHDRDPLVRAGAATALLSLPADERLRVAAPLLRDPVRLVRIQAAWVLLPVAAERFEAGDRQAFEKAFNEYLDSQTAAADMPATWLNLAQVESQRGNQAAAERAYRRALSMDPYLVPALTGLASFLSAGGRNAEAERVLKDGVTRIPDDGRLRYWLGLLLVEEGRPGEAADELGRAARAAPGDAQVLYNYGVVLQQLGRREEAERALLAADTLAGRDSDAALALAVLYRDEREWARALPYAERWADRHPDDARARELVRDIRTRLEAGR